MRFCSCGQKSTVFTIFCLLFGLSSCDQGGDGEVPVPAVVDAGAATSLRPELATEPDRAVFTEVLPYGEQGEQLVYGYFAFPADMVAPMPAVILIHDRWGVDELTQGLSRRMAAEGYIVMAIDLFDGEVADSPGQARTLEIQVFENPQFAADKIQQAYLFLKDTFGAPTVASLGFGFGGGWSLNAAMLLSGELNASVIYYGQVSDDERRLAAIQAPVLGLFAENDRVITTKSVLAFEVKLEALEKENEIEILAGAGRGFADARSNNYNTETEVLAWRQTVEFLDKHLSNGVNQ